jgi:hypothetical protein
MSESATAIPREINLGLQKPVATPAYTRRFKSQSGVASVQQGTQVTITLDTAQPGSFIDCASSYLSFKLRLINSNPNRGYNATFSACGAHALFRAMRIYVQGVPIEEITEYSALVEWLHDLAGIPDYNDRSAKSEYFANTMFSDQVIYLPPSSTRIMNIQLPLVSGVLGTMADKMFPSMLVAPGNCYIQLDIATAAHALKIQEIDLTTMKVGTSPVAGTFGLQDSVVTNATAARVPDRSTAVVSTFTAGKDAMIGYVNATVVEDYGPYDTPYEYGTAVGANHNVGVISTEERIGGGMFYADSVTDYASTSNSLTFSADVGTSATAAATVVKTAMSNQPDSANDIFLGGGMTAQGAAQNSGNVKRLTESTTISQFVRFELQDLEYVGKQIVVGDDVARAIIERAAQGDISIHTQSYRQYPSSINVATWKYQVDPAYSNMTLNPKDGLPLCNMWQRIGTAGAQSLIIPAKISSANAIYCIFRNPQSDNDFRFDSLRRQTVGFSDQSDQGGITAQLRIGNELIPQSPIQSSSECLMELLKAHHMDGAYGTGEKMGSIVASAAQYTWPQSTGIQTRRFNLSNSVLAGPAIPRLEGFDTDKASPEGGILYSRNDYNSQILCPSPAGVSFAFPTFADYVYNAGGARSFFAPLGATLSGTDPSFADQYYHTTTAGRQDYSVIQLAAGAVTAQTFYGESGLDYASRQTKWKDAVRRAFFGYASERSDHQIVDPSKDNFMNPFKQHTGRYSTFMLGFDLDTFSHNSDVVRSGHYLGNNTVSLNLSDVRIIDNSPMNMPLQNNLKMDTFILHDLRLSFQQGGTVQAFY